MRFCRRQGFVQMKLDISKAFDQVRRSKILSALQATGLPPRIIWSLAREMLQCYMIPSLYAITTPAPIETQAGVRQGAPESGPIFCVCLAAVLREVVQEWQAKGFGHSVGPFGDLSTMVGFAEDT